MSCDKCGLDAVAAAALSEAYEAAMSMLTDASTQLETLKKERAAEAEERERARLAGLDPAKLLWNDDVSAEIGKLLDEDLGVYWQIKMIEKSAGNDDPAGCVSRAEEAIALLQKLIETIRPVR